MVEFLSTLWTYITENVVESIYLGLVAVVTFLLKYYIKKAVKAGKDAKEAKKAAEIKEKQCLENSELEQEVIKAALLSVLHDILFQRCSIYISRGEISIREMSNLKHLHTSYNSLGGNDDGDALYIRCRDTLKIVCKSYDYEPEDKIEGAEH